MSDTGLHAVAGMAFGRYGGPRRIGGHHAPDRLATSLNDDPRVEKMMIVDHFESLAGRAKDLARRRQASSDESMTPLRWRRRDSGRSVAARTDYRLWDLQVQVAHRQRGLWQPIVITCNPLVAGFAPMSWAGRVCYYAIDDWLAHHGQARTRPALDEAYAAIRSKQLPVVAVSDAVLEAVGSPGPSLVLPNGVDPSEWEAPESPPSWFADLPRPTVTYMGRLDDRFDIDAVRAAAAARPDVTFVVVGPGHDQAAFVDLGQAANVAVHGPIPRPEVAAVLSASDACMVSHVDNPLTRSMSPLKLFEYLAAGRPVAARRFPPVEGVHDHVTLYDDPADLAEAVDAALAAGPMSEADRETFAVGRSWSSRHAELLTFAAG